MTTLYGIKNCDTVKKARRWLDEHNIDYRFHDFRADGITPEQVQTWLDELGWETLINKRSTTWKSLPDEVKTRLDASSAADLVVENPTLIKRPLLAHAEQYSVGFKADTYATIF